MARTQRGSVRPVSVTGFHQASFASAGMVYGSDLTTRSGGPPNRSAKYHFDASGHSTGAGMSSGLPRGAPPSTHRTIVSSSASVSDLSFLKSVIPTVRSMCQGGICRVETRSLMERAQGRDSS